MIAQRPIERTVPPTHVMGIARFERFFRAAAGLDVDKEDLKRYADFINRKIRDLLIRGEAVAKANGRDFIQPVDLPITKGMQESIDRFKEHRRDHRAEAHPGSSHRQPPLDLDLGEETEAELYAMGGGLSLALARTFKIIDPTSRTRKRAIGSVRSRSSTCCCSCKDGRAMAAPVVHSFRRGRLASAALLNLHGGRWCGGCGPVARNPLLLNGGLRRR